MDFVYGKMNEAEMDLAIVDSILREKKVADLFFQEAGFSGEIIKVYHSLTEQQSDGTMGESDIVLLIQNECGAMNVIFIEDKINAEVMPMQRQRYDDRALILQRKEGFVRYAVILCAPQRYLDSSRRDGYDHVVSYENIWKNLEDDVLKSRFAYCMEEKQLGYVPEKCEPVTLFWDNLYQYIDANYGPFMPIVKTAGARGKNACWPTFKTNIRNVYIRWKTDRDVIDLEFGGMGNNKKGLIEKLNAIGENTFDVVQTGKSASLRYRVPKEFHVNFSNDFDKQIPNIDLALKAVLKFFKIVNKLQYLGIESSPIQD